MSKSSREKEVLSKFDRSGTSGSRSYSSFTRDERNTVRDLERDGKLKHYVADVGRVRYYKDK